ncbi:M61 family metallopeptidase [Hymenobacter cellulosilyticus]|uniref:Peptidase M61 n=1 Tax=Hymenobacter cellulosilyticus TaxID=2932248 RepID=A0A8T9Q746_9BACT|nr:peptidase M61 [Hymenobacter cellulosilyticus]UOQ73397.1 peptidase M61 [Hymenobacter cellulosilyticus]
MKLFSLALGLTLAAAMPAVAQQPAGYQIDLDLEHATNDQVRVVIKTPPVKEAQATYVMPSVVPGSYSRKDYGRFVQNFLAFDRKGQKLKVRKEGSNLFIIDKAPNLARIEYSVDDTWDAKQDEGFIFQPGGTNFEAGQNFVLNHYGLYGYLEGYKMQPYQVTVAKPATLYGATSLTARRNSATQDVFTAASYVELADSPILYSRPDTASFSTGGARIAVSVVSETGTVKAEQVREIMRPMAEALTKFFGQMPVPKYHFLMYFPSFSSPLASKNGGYGAMEHSYSSVYFLPEVPGEDRLRSMVQEVASHEFLHMLAPLNIHSREIGEFDFRNPKMSQHLWLYEGVTEYIAQLVQVRGGLSTPAEFRQTMKQKIDKAAKHPDVSFTEMSRNILEAPYKDMYDNVYDKGALLGLLLDIRIQELSQGRQSLRDVLLALRQKYGPTRSFEDAQLIPEVVALTNPALQQFFDQYVIGNQPLPYAEYFDKIGWRFQATAQSTVKAFGQLGFSYDTEKKQFIAASTKADQNAFGLKEGDVILAVNGTTVDMSNAEKLLRPLVEPTTGDVVKVRFRSAGSSAPQERQAAPREFDVQIKNALEEVATPTPAQLQLRNQVLKPLG